MIVLRRILRELMRTEAIRAMHQWCNARNIPPSYEGVATFALQARAEIQINTDLDFGGADRQALVTGWLRP